MIIHGDHSETFNCAANPTQYCTGKRCVAFHPIVNHDEHFNNYFETGYGWCGRACRPDSHEFQLLKQNTESQRQKND